MGRYTAYEDTWIEEQIELQLRLVTTILMNASDIQTIMLAGGFGRGEGSIFIRNGKVMPLRDYDIILIVPRKMPVWRLHQLIDEVNERIGSESFSVSILQFTLDEILNFPDIKTYDMKTGSIILYGQDIRTRIKLDGADIPPSSIARIFFHNMLGLTQFFSPMFLDKEPDRLSKLNLVLECAKTYLNIGAVLTLMQGKYKPTYTERCKIVQDGYKTTFHSLAEKIPDLAEKISFFTDLKLRPDETTINNFNAMQLWFDTIEDLRVVFEYYMNFCFRVPNTQNMIEFYEKCYSRMVSSGLDSYMSSYARAKVGTDFKPLIKFMGYLFRRYYALRFVKGAHDMRQPFNLNLLMDFPMFKFYCSIPLLLYSLKRNRTLDEALFNAFTRSINTLIPFKVKSTSADGKWKEGVECLETLKGIMYISFE